MGEMLMGREGGCRSVCRHRPNILGGMEITFNFIQKPKLCYLKLGNQIMEQRDKR